MSRIPPYSAFARRTPSGGRQGGFGLLEALVALVIFAGLGLAVFDWINTNLEAATRLQKRERVQHAERLAAAWVQTLDPLQHSSGQDELEPGLRLSWTTRWLTPLTKAAPFAGGTGTPFRLALIEVDITVIDSRRSSAAASEPLARLVLTRIGVERDPFIAPLPGANDDP